MINLVPQVLQVYCLFLVVFTVLGVELMGGRLGTCQPNLSGNATADMAAAEAAIAEAGSGAVIDALTASRCAVAGGRWEPDAFGTFDNAYAASLMLFELSTLDGWPDLTLSGMAAARAADPSAIGVQGPTLSTVVSVVYGAYFVSWVLLGGMLLLNVIVGFLVDEVCSALNLKPGTGKAAPHPLLRPSSSTRDSSRKPGAAMTWVWTHPRLHMPNGDGRRRSMQCSSYSRTGCHIYCRVRGPAAGPSSTSSTRSASSACAFSSCW